MKKTLILAVLLSAFGCGTLTQSGSATTAQKTKPVAGQPKRQMKAGAFIFGVFVPVSLIVDFSTSKIYRKG